MSEYTHFIFVFNIYSQVLICLLLTMLRIVDMNSVGFFSFSRPLSIVFLHKLMAVLSILYYCYLQNILPSSLFRTFYKAVEVNLKVLIE